MNRNKLLPRLIWIWVCIGLCILLVDHLLLRNIIVDQVGCSAYKLVTPPATNAARDCGNVDNIDTVRVVY